MTDEHPGRSQDSEEGKRINSFLRLGAVTKSCRVSSLEELNSIVEQKFKLLKGSYTLWQCGRPVQELTRNCTIEIMTELKGGQRDPFWIWVYTERDQRSFQINPTTTMRSLRETIRRAFNIGDAWRLVNEDNDIMSRVPSLKADHEYWIMTVEADMANEYRSLTEEFPRDWRRVEGLPRPGTRGKRVRFSLRFKDPGNWRHNPGVKSYVASSMEELRREVRIHFCSLSDDCYTLVTSDGRPVEQVIDSSSMEALRNATIEIVLGGAESTGRR
jgi:hypothetical protein